MAKLKYKYLNKLNNVFFDFKFEFTLLEDIIPKKFETRNNNKLVHPPHSTSYFILNYLKTEEISNFINYSEYHNFIDIGCGYGRVLLFFRRFFESKKINYNLNGIELEKILIKKARKNTRKYSNISILQGDAMNINYPDKSIIFLFNPFDRLTLGKFIDKLQNSKKNYLVIFWGHNKFEIFPHLDEVKIFNVLHPFNTNNSKLLMYKILSNK